MKKVTAEPHRDIDFSWAKRGPVIPAEPGKTKMSIRIGMPSLSRLAPKSIAPALATTKP